VSAAHPSGSLTFASKPLWTRWQVLAPALAVVLAGYAIQRADVTRLQRAPFQGPQAVLARETMRRTLEPRSVVITTEDIGRPAENIEHYGGFPAIYITDLERWHIRPSDASVSFLFTGVRPYLLVASPKGRSVNESDVRDRARVLADLAANGFVAERILEIPAARNMEYFVASPASRNIDSELFRISHPKWEQFIAPLKIEPGAKPGA
jgi:hypothetical protein